MQKNNNESDIIMEAFMFLYYRYTFARNGDSSNGEDENALYEVHPNFQRELELFMNKYDAKTAK